MKRSEQAERDARIVELFRSGRTLESIGQQFALTRQAVGLITKAHGLRRADGGASKRVREKREAVSTRLKKLCEGLGCDEELYARLRAMHERYWQTPIGRYIQHRRGAANRGIEFNLTLVQWWHLWEQSGHYGERGRRRGQFHMARRLDRGPYSIDNVEIQTCYENIQTQAVVRRMRRVGHRNAPETAKDQFIDRREFEFLSQVVDACDDFESE